MKYRVWCKNKREWETNDMMLRPDGKLFDLNNHKLLRSDTHIVELKADIEGIKDVYAGDILFYEGSNGNLGYEANDDPDGTYVVEFKNGKFEAVCPWSDERWDLDDFAFDRVIGNIHENEDLVKVDRQSELTVTECLPTYDSLWDFR